MKNSLKAALVGAVCGAFAFVINAASAGPTSIIDEAAIGASSLTMDIRHHHKGFSPKGDGDECGSCGRNLRCCENPIGHFQCVSKRSSCRNV